MSAVLTDAVLEALAECDNDFQRASLLLRKRCREDSRLLLAIVDPWLNGAVAGMVAKVAQNYGIADRYGSTTATTDKANSQQGVKGNLPTNNAAVQAKPTPALSTQQIDQVVQAWGSSQPDAVTPSSTPPVSVISQLSKPAVDRPPTLGRIAAKRQQETLGQLAAAYKKS